MRQLSSYGCAGPTFAVTFDMKPQRHRGVRVHGVVGRRLPIFRVCCHEHLQFRLRARGHSKLEKGWPLLLHLLVDCCNSIWSTKNIPWPEPVLSCSQNPSNVGWPSTPRALRGSITCVHTPPGMVNGTPGCANSLSVALRESSLGASPPCTQRES